MARIRFPLTLRGNLLDVDITPDGATYTLREGEGLVFRHEGEEVALSPEQPACERALAPPPVEGA
jgi:alpha,alpha-trehalose phosphorylase